MQDSDGHVEKKKDKKKPEYVGADGDIRAVLKKLLDFLGAEVAAGVEIDDQRDLNDQDAAESKQAEKEQVKPGPGDAEIFRQESIGRRRRRERGGRIGGEGNYVGRERCVCGFGRMDHNARSKVID